MKRINFLIIIFIICFSPQTLADYQLGYQYYERGNLEKAYNEFLQAAGYGDKDAQYNLGAMYFRGEHVDKDMIEGYAWFALAAQNPEYKEQGVHDKIFTKLSKDEQQKAAARKEALFEKYSDEAISQNLSPVLDIKQTPKRNYRPRKRKAPEFPKTQARRGAEGWVDVMFTIEKDGTTRDHLAFYSTTKDFEEVSLEAMRHWIFDPTLIDGRPVITTGVRTRLRFDLSNREHNERRITRLLGNMKNEAEEGGAEEQFRYAYFIGSLANYVDTQQLNDNPTEWYEKSANNGHSAAAYFLGLNVLTGEMCEADTYKSAGWLLKAASQNVADAQYTLAIEYLTGARFEKDETKGLYWLEKAAQGLTPAQLRYAWVLSTHPDENVRNLERAQSLLDNISDNYHDKQALFEARAAVAAESGDFETAIHWQQQALEDAAALELPMKISQQKLEHYQSEKPWRERL